MLRLFVMCRAGRSVTLLPFIVRWADTPRKHNVVPLTYILGCYIGILSGKHRLSDHVHIHPFIGFR